MNRGLSDLFQFNLWANMALVEACSALSDTQLDMTIKGVYGSVRDTLVHLVRAEEGYARRVDESGTAPVPPLHSLTEFPGFDELKRRLEWSGNALMVAAEQADLDRVLLLDDGKYTATVNIVLMQAIAHGVEHRVEITAILNQHDIAALELSVWSYNNMLRS